MDPHQPNYPPGNQNPPPFAPYPPQYPMTNNGKAIAALVLGISSLAALLMLPGLGIVIGILGIIFGILALKELKTRRQAGQGMAIAGLICGGLGTLIHLIMIAFIVFAFIAALAYGTSEGSYSEDTYYEDGVETDMNTDSFY